MSDEDDQIEWDDVITSYTPPEGDAVKGVLEFTDKYGDELLRRIKRLQRNFRHPSVDYPKMRRMFEDVDHARTEKLARSRFESFEFELSGQLDDLAQAAFDGPDDDATIDDVRWRDDISPLFHEPEYRERP